MPGRGSGSAPAGLRFGRAGGPLPVTDRQSARLLRLPIHAGMSDGERALVTDAVLAEVGR